MVVYQPTGGDPTAADPIDRTSCRPDFQIVIYPGRWCSGSCSHQHAPAFFLAANDDLEPARTITDLVQKYRLAAVPAEVHLFTQGGHAFNMGNRSNWPPSRLAATHGGLDGRQSPPGCLPSGSRQPAPVIFRPKAAFAVCLAMAANSGSAEF